MDVLVTVQFVMKNMCYITDGMWMYRMVDYSEAMTICSILREYEEKLEYFRWDIEGE